MKSRAYERGFTLVELLVVIAIIAILVLIVVVVIDPVSRINDGQNARANSDVRSTASAVSACITEETDPYTSTCASETFLKNNNYLLNKPASVQLTVNSPSADKVCIYGEGESGNYASWQSETSELVVAPYGVVTCA